MFSGVILSVFLFFGFSSGGVIRQMIDACKMCGEEDGVMRCTGAPMAAVVSVEACPGGHLWTGSDLLVTELRGWASQLQLTSTTLKCQDMPVGTLAVLNGEKCKAGDFGMMTESESTTTTTTTKRTPWWPVPFPVPEDVHVHYNGTSTTSTSTTTTMTVTTSSSSSARDTTTIMIAVTAGFQLNQTLIIVTVAVAITVFGTVVSVRCVRRRRRRPIQVQEITSSICTPATPPVSPRRRRQQGSYESIELFVRSKED